MYEQRYGFSLQGISPLLMHADNIEWADTIDVERTWIKENDKANFKSGDDRCPAHTWKGYLYNDGQHVVIPNDNLRACFMKAGARITLSGKKSYKELSQCGILFDEMYLTFKIDGKQIDWKPVWDLKGTFAEQCEAVKKLGFSLFTKRAAIGQAKHVRVRPRFEKWSIEGTVIVVDEQMTEKVLTELFRIGGRYLGLCDWRPGSPRSPGWFGQFSAELTKL